MMLILFYDFLFLFRFKNSLLFKRGPYITVSLIDGSNKLLSNFTVLHTAVLTDTQIIMGTDISPFITE